MADRYWVLGSGNLADTAHWALSSNGTPGASAPGASDNAIFDQNSDVLGVDFTVTINADQSVLNFDNSAADVNITFAGINSLSVFGNFALRSGTVWTNTGNLTWAATSTGFTITTNGVSLTTLNHSFFNGAGGGWTLQDDLTIPQLELIQGALTFGSHNISTPFGISLVGLNAGKTGSIDFGTGEITITGNNRQVVNGVGGGTWSCSGSKLIHLTYSGSTGTRSWGSFIGNSESTYVNYKIDAATDTINGMGLCLDWDASAFTGTLSTSTGSNYDFYGSVKFNAAVTFSQAGWNFRWKATSGTKTLTTNGLTIDAIPTIDGVGGTFQLADNCTWGSTRTFTLTNGTLDLNTATMTTGLFSSSNSNTRGITFGSGSRIILTGNSTTVWTTATATNLTITGTSLVESNYSGASGTRTFTANSATGSESTSVNLKISSGTDTITITTGNAFKSIDLTGFAGTFSGGTNTLTLYGSLTVPGGISSFAASSGSISFKNTSGTAVITSSGILIDRPITFDGVGGTFQLSGALTLGSTRTVTLTNGTLSLSSYALTCNTFSGSNSNARTIGFGTGKIVLTGNAGTIWTTSTVTGLTVSGTPTVECNYSGSTGTRTITSGTLSEANSVSFKITAGSDIVSSGAVNRDLILTGFTGTWSNLTRTVYGSLNVASGCTVTTGTLVTTFSGTSGTQVITSNTKTLDFPITFDGTGGTFQLGDAFSPGSTRTITHTNGTIDLNGKTATLGTYVTATGTKNITFNSGTIVITTSGATAFNNAVPTGFTTTAGTGTGTISLTSASAKTFVGGGSTYTAVINQGGAGALTITGSNTFDNITNTTQPASVLFTAGTTTTFVTGFSLSGTASNLITINSATAATHTLSMSSGTVSVSYCSISFSIATGGATWDAFTINHNVSGGNNTGWIFTVPGSNPGAFLPFFMP